MADTMILTTDADGLAKMPQTYYDRVLMSRLLPNIMWPLFGQPKPMPRNAGKSIQWRLFNPLPAVDTELQEGITPEAGSVTMDTLTATPKQQGHYLRVTDVVDLTSFDPVLTEFAELLGEQAADKYDELVRDVICAGTNVQYCGSSNVQTSDVASGDVITTAEVRKAVRTLQLAKIKPLTSIISATDGVGTTPIPACYIGIIGANTLYDMKSESNGAFIPVHKYPSQVALLPGEVGSLDNVRFIMSDNAKIKTGLGTGSIDVHCTLIIGQGAYGVVTLDEVHNIIKGFGSGDDPLNQRMTTGWKAYFVAVRLQELALLRLEHAVGA